MRWRNKLDFLRALSSRQVLEISKDGYQTSYFKLNDSGDILSYTCGINFDYKYSIREDITIDKLLEHLLQMQREEFTIHELETDIIHEKDFLLEMIESCYVYGDDIHTSTVSNSCSKYYGKPYIQEFYDKLGKDTVEALYEGKMRDMIENYKVVSNVYTDGDGCTYNTLVRKEV